MSKPCVKDTEGNEGRQNKKGALRRVSRPEQARLTKQLELNPLPVNRDHLNSETYHFAPGDSGRLRSSTMT